MTTALSAAYRLLGDPQVGAAASRRQLFIFSDRTVSSWETARIADLQGQSERLGDPPPVAVYLDLGIEKPVDVAIIDAEVKPAALPANREVVLRATVSAVGQDCDTEIVCKLTGDSLVQRRPIKLASGQTEEIEFINRRLQPGLYQAELTLATPDALAPGNSRFVTFEVRGTRKILTITDRDDLARLWELAFEVKDDFQCEVVTPDRVHSLDHLKPYLAVCLFSVRNPAELGLWKPLRQYAEQGGHVIVVPGRDEMKPRDYVDEDALAILPGVPEKVMIAPEGQPARWEPLNRRHPLLAKFATWRERDDIGFLQSPRSAYRYWLVKPQAPQWVVVGYDTPGKPPALLERQAGSARGGGRVLMLTTALDFRDPRDNPEPWNNYASTAVNDGFFVVLANELVGYAVGDWEEPTFNFASGQTVTLPLPPAARFPEYTLDAPGVTGTDTRLLRGETDTELTIRQTNFAGNARVSAGNSPWKTGFSLNPSGDEFRLDRLPVESIEQLLGPNSVVTPGPNAALTDALGDRVRQPLDLFPWLMLAFLGLLAAEGIVANRFYKPDAPETAAA